MVGMQNQFTPEQLGVISSSALAYSIFEMIVYSITLYVSNITASMKTLDLLAFCGYKFVTINLCILISIIFKRFGYYLALLYTSFSLCFFLVSDDNCVQYFLFRFSQFPWRMQCVSFDIFWFCVFFQTASYAEGKNFTRITGHCVLRCVWKCSTVRCAYRL